MPNREGLREAPARPAHPTAAGLAQDIAEITEQLRQPVADLPALGTRIATLRARWPDDLRLRLLQGSWLEAARQPDEALACYRAAQAAHAGNPWPAVRIVELLLRQRRPEEARACFIEAVWQDSAPERTRVMLLSQTTASIPDLPGREAYLHGLLRQHPDDRFVLTKLAVLRYRQKDRAAAAALFEAAARLGPITDEGRMMQLELHLAEARFEAAHAVAADLHARHPDRVEFVRRLIQTALFLNRMEEAVTRLEAALLRWPEDWLLLYRFNRCPLPGAADRRIFAALTERQAAVAENERWQFQYAIASLRHAPLAPTLALLRRIAGTPAVGHMATPLLAALEAHPPACWANPRGVSNAAEDEVQLLRREDAVATVILFSSVAGGLGYLPFGLADGLLRQRPVHVIYLRDRNHRAFAQGVTALGPDHAAMIEALQGMTRPLGLPVVTMGSSIAGVAAIRAATRMQALAAISFAGPANLGRDAMEDEPPPPGAIGGTRDTLVGRIAGAEADVLEMIRAAPGTRVHQSFGTGFAPDVAVARLLEPFPNVRLHPEPGCADHFAIEHAIASGGFLAILDAALAPGGAA